MESGNQNLMNMLLHGGASENGSQQIEGFGQQFATSASGPNMQASLTSPMGQQGYQMMSQSNMMQQGDLMSPPYSQSQTSFSDNSYQGYPGYSQQRMTQPTSSMYYGGQNGSFLNSLGQFNTSNRNMGQYSQSQSSVGYGHQNYYNDMYQAKSPAPHQLPGSGYPIAGQMGGNTSSYPNSGYGGQTSMSPLHKPIGQTFFPPRSPVSQQINSPPNMTSTFPGQQPTSPMPQPMTGHGPRRSSASPVSSMVPQSMPVYSMPGQQAQFPSTSTSMSQSSCMFAQRLEKMSAQHQYQAQMTSSNLTSPTGPVVSPSRRSSFPGQHLPGMHPMKGSGGPVSPIQQSPPQIGKTSPPFKPMKSPPPYQSSPSAYQKTTMPAPYPPMPDARKPSNSDGQPPNKKPRKSVSKEKSSMQKLEEVAENVSPHLAEGLSYAVGDPVEPIKERMLPRQPEGVGGTFDAMKDKVLPVKQDSVSDAVKPIKDKSIPRQSEVDPIKHTNNKVLPRQPEAVGDFVAQVKDKIIGKKPAKNHKDEADPNAQAINDRNEELKKDLEQMLGLQSEKKDNNCEDDTDVKEPQGDGKDGTLTDKKTTKEEATTDKDLKFEETSHVEESQSCCTNKITNCTENVDKSAHKEQDDKIVSAVGCKAGGSKEDRTSEDEEIATYATKVEPQLSKKPKAETNTDKDECPEKLDKPVVAEKDRKNLSKDDKDQDIIPKIEGEVEIIKTDTSRKDKPAIETTVKTLEITETKDSKTQSIQTHKKPVISPKDTKTLISKTPPKSPATKVNISRSGHPPTIQATVIAKGQSAQSNQQVLVAKTAAGQMYLIQGNVLIPVQNITVQQPHGEKGNKVICVNQGQGKSSHVMVGNITPNLTQKNDKIKTTPPQYDQDSDDELKSEVNEKMDIDLACREKTLLSPTAEMADGENQLTTVSSQTDHNVLRSRLSKPEEVPRVGFVHPKTSPSAASKASNLEKSLNAIKAKLEQERNNQEQNVEVKKRIGRPPGSKDKQKRKSYLYKKTSEEPSIPQDNIITEKNISEKNKISTNIPTVSKTSRQAKRPKMIPPPLSPTRTLSIQPRGGVDGDKWVCSFCGKPSNHSSLGVLYGPYKARLSRDRVDNRECRSPDKLLSPGSRIPELPLELDGSNIELWMHKDCGTWSQGLYMLGRSIYGLEQAVESAACHKCSTCMELGATLACFKRGCNSIFHFACARDSGCAFLEENFTIFCSIHK